MLIKFPKIYSYFKKSATEKVAKNCCTSTTSGNLRLTQLKSDVISKEKPSGSIVELESSTLKFVSEGNDLGVLLIRKALEYAKKGYPDYYKSGSSILIKPSMEINILRSHKKGIGVGTKLVQEAVKKSFELGYDGRVVINAISIDGKTSPLAFYYKLGFRSIDDKTNKMIEKYIKKNKTIPQDKSTSMYLPKENIASLLAR